MNSNTISVSSAVLALPARPNLEHLKNEAKQRLEILRAAAPDSQLSDAQFQLARDYGFTSWRELKAFVDEQSKLRSTNAALGNTEIANAEIDCAGDWIGELGKNARIALHVTRNDNGTLNATVDSRDVGVFDLPAQHFNTDASQLSFGVYIPAAAGNYEASYTGSWDAANQTLTGQWLAHGVNIPFIFKRGTFPRAPIIEGIDGFWDGTLEAQGRYRMTFQIKTDHHGTFAWLDSPDRNSYRVPVTSIIRDDRRITFALQTVTVSGELSADDQTLQGQFIRGETLLPLTLTRRPRGAAIPRGVERATVVVPLETLNKYVGVYTFAPERTLAISIVGNDLFAQYPHQPAIQLFASSSTEFFWKQFDASVVFEVVDGNVVALAIHQQGRSTRAVHNRSVAKARTRIE